MHFDNLKAMGGLYRIRQIVNRRWRHRFAFFGYAATAESS